MINSVYYCDKPGMQVYGSIEDAQSRSLDGFAIVATVASVSGRVSDIRSAAEAAGYPHQTVSIESECELGSASAHKVVVMLFGRHQELRIKPHEQAIVPLRRRVEMLNTWHWESETIAYHFRAHRGVDYSVIDRKMLSSESGMAYPDYLPLAPLQRNVVHHIVARDGRACDMTPHQYAHIRNIDVSDINYRHVDRVGDRAYAAIHPDWVAWVIINTEVVQ